MEKYTFFNSVDHDRIHRADDFARHLSKYFANGIFNNECMVLADNNDMSVNVSIGSANINGYRYDNDSLKRLEIENADGVLNRIDNIVIRWDLTNRMITAQVVKGDYSNEPVAPELERTTTIYDLRIATVSIPAGTTTITQDLINDTRFINSDCGNVICAVQTPNTENLFLQMQAELAKELSSFNEKLVKHNSDFDTWFKTIKNQLDGNIATNLANNINRIVDAGIKSYLETLLKENWQKNEVTDRYVYRIDNENITGQHLILIIPDIDNQQKFSDAKVESFDGYFLITNGDLPEDNIDVTIAYELTNLTLEVV